MTITTYANFSENYTFRRAIHVAASSLTKLGETSVFESLGQKNIKVSIIHPHCALYEKKKLKASNAIFM